MKSNQAHKPHKSIDISLNESSQQKTKQKYTSLKYGGQIGKGLYNQGLLTQRGQQIDLDLQTGKDANQSEGNRLAKYFMNKLAKSKSISDIGARQL